MFVVGRGGAGVVVTCGMGGATFDTGVEVPLVVVGRPLFLAGGCDPLGKSSAFLLTVNILGLTDGGSDLVFTSVADGASDLVFTSVALVRVCS